MAKVRSMPTRNILNFDVNDALSDLVSLEVCDESPPKYDINLLLNDDNSASYQQPADTDDVKKNVNNSVISFSERHIAENLTSLISTAEACLFELLEENTRNKYAEDHSKECEVNKSASMAPITSNCNNLVVNNHISLSALAQNHLRLDEKPKELKDSCCSLDFTLEDLISDIGDDTVTVKNSTLSNSNDLNLFSLSFSPVNNPKLGKEHQAEVVADDLSILLDSSETQQKPSSFSLADLANNHFLTNLPSNSNEFPKENSSNGNAHVSEISVLDGLESILSSERFEIGAFTSSESICNTLDIKNCIDVNKNSFYVKDKISPAVDVSDDEIVPDIDLSFCIKKPKSVPKDKLVFNSSSPESTDSGFDETDSELKCISSFQDFVSFQSISPYGKEFTSPLTNPKESLLSKAISCKPKPDKIKSEKLKIIRRGLCNKHSPTELFDSIVPNSTRFDGIIDRSNRSVFCCEIADQ